MNNLIIRISVLLVLCLLVSCSSINNIETDEIFPTEMMITLKDLPMGWKFLNDGSEKEIDGSISYYRLFEFTEGNTNYKIMQELTFCKDSELAINTFNNLKDNEYSSNEWGESDLIDYFPENQSDLYKQACDDFSIDGVKMRECDIIHQNGRYVFLYYFFGNREVFPYDLTNEILKITDERLQQYQK